MRVYEHTIHAPSRGLPLTLKVTCAYDGANLDHWDLAINGHVQSPQNRTTLMRILHDPVRDGISGDCIGAKWVSPDAVELWDQHRHWRLTRKQARTLQEAILMAIGRAAGQAKEDAKTPEEREREARLNEDPRDARIRELEEENARLQQMVRFLKQYAPA